MAVTGLVYPVWAMISMALSVTTTFINSLGADPHCSFKPSAMPSAAWDEALPSPQPSSAHSGREVA